MISLKKNTDTKSVAPARKQKTEAAYNTTTHHRTINYAGGIHYHNMEHHYCELINNDPAGKTVISKSNELLKLW